MPAPQPRTIASDVGGELDRWLAGATSYMSQDSWTFKSIGRSIDKLTNSDPYEASLMRAVLLHCTGDADGAMHWIQNARRWPGESDSCAVECLILCNLGFFSRAAEAFFNLKQPARGTFARIAVVAGAFTEVIDLHRELPHIQDEQFHRAAENAVRCAMTLEQLNISQAQLRRVLDLAGDVLRQHALFFVDRDAVVHAHGDVFLYQLMVDVEPGAAAEMTDEVVERMVQNELDLPGLAFSFIGTRQRNAVHGN